MPISGTKLLTDNYNAGLAYGRAVNQIVELIEEWFAECVETPLPEPDLIGYVMALRGAAEVEPRLSQVMVGSKTVDRWKEAFEKWIEQFGSKVKVKRGVSREELWEKTLQEFDAL